MQYPHPSPVSLVTGGAGALGAELVRRFATQGDTVVLLDNNAEAAERQAQEITRDTGARVETAIVDLADDADGS